MGAEDNLFQKTSTFMHELREAGIKDASIFRVGAIMGFVRRSGTTRAEGPRGARVCAAKRNRIGRRWRVFLPFACCFTPRCQASEILDNATERSLVIMVRVTSREIPPRWGSIRFCLAHYTYAPWGCIIRAGSLTTYSNVIKGKSPPKNVTVLL